MSAMYVDSKAVRKCVRVVNAKRPLAVISLDFCFLLCS